DPAESAAFIDVSGFVDDFGNSHDAVATNVTFGVAGRIAGGPTAASFNGTSSAAATDPGLSPPADTAATYSGSAWVTVAATGGPARAIVSRDGTRTSAFTLGYSGPDNKWSFSIAASDVDNPTTTTLLSGNTATANRWTLVVGSYDASTRRMTMYVDGVPQ